MKNRLALLGTIVCLATSLAGLARPPQDPQTYRYDPRDADGEQLSGEIQDAMKISMTGEAARGFVKVTKEAILVTFVTPLTEAQKATLDRIVADHRPDPSRKTAAGTPRPGELQRWRTLYQSAKSDGQRIAAIAGFLGLTAEEKPVEAPTPTTLPGAAHP